MLVFIVADVVLFVLLGLLGLKCLLCGFFGQEKKGCSESHAISLAIVTVLRICRFASDPSSPVCFKGMWMMMA